MERLIDALYCLVENLRVTRFNWVGGEVRGKYCFCSLFDGTHKVGCSSCVQVYLVMFGQVMPLTRPQGSFPNGTFVVVTIAHC